MAHLLRADAIDFAAYERNTEAATKVRSAADFFDDVETEFAERERGKRHPEMFSTKARGLIEFRPGEVTAWTGFNGHRKSMFVSQVCLDLGVQHQRVLIASFEMTPGKTLARMARQASGTARPDPSWLQAFRKWSNDRLWIFDHLGRVSTEMAVGMCRYFAEELKGTHVVIDSFMMVCGSEEHMDEQKQFVTDLVRVAQETGLHVHLVTHARKPGQGGEDRPPTKYDIRGSGAISDQCANVITVWANKAKAAKLEENPHDAVEAEKPDALVTIEKQRNGSWEGRLKLWFDPTSLRFCDDRISAVVPYELQGVGR
jgi:twinkle protein